MSAKSAAPAAGWHCGPWGEKPEALHEEMLPKIVKKPDVVKDLDVWRRDELPVAVACRVPPHVTHDEMKKLMQHKLSKFKFRPGLQKYVDELDPDLVKSTSTRALAALHADTSEAGARAALKILCELKGIGPATASSLLSAIAPDRVSYTSDEALSVVLAAGPLASYKPRYTVDEVWALAAALRPVADQLNAAGSAVRWTIETVQRSLWARLRAKTQGIPLPADTSSLSAGGPKAAVGGASGADAATAERGSASATHVGEKRKRSAALDRAPRPSDSTRAVAAVSAPSRGRRRMSK